MSGRLTDCSQGAGGASSRILGGSQPRGFLGTLSILQIHLLVLTLVLTAGGLVPVEDVTFVILISAYIVVLNKVAFPPVTSEVPPNFFKKTRLFVHYVTLGAVVGLLLPVGYLLGSFVQGDKKALRSASPHLFLLSCQVLTENFAYGNPLSLLVRAFVPISYNTRRLFTISDWARADFTKEVGDLDSGLESGSIPPQAGAWISFGQILAGANMVFWTFNLFGFLLPVYLPQAFRAHYDADASRKQKHVGKSSVE